MTNLNPPVPTRLHREAFIEELRELRFDEYWCSYKLRIPAIRYVARTLQRYHTRGLLAPVRPTLSAAADELDLLIALLLFQCPVDKARMARILSSKALDFLLEANLVAEQGSSLQASVLLFPSGGNYIATDGFTIHPNINRVMPLYPESYDLPRLAVKRQGTVALDLCTGSGVVALWISRSVKEVVGVDISARALAFAQFNAWLNGVSNVCFIRSDLYSGVPTRQFDLVTSNTPYNPELTTTAGSNYHSGGASGEELLSRVVRELPEHLSPDGFAHIITLVIHREGEHLETKLRAWLPRNAAVDIAVLARPSTYRPQVLQGSGGLTPIEQELHRNWQAQKIQRFEFGLINMKRAPGERPPFFTRTDFRAETLTPPPDISRLFSEA